MGLLRLPENNEGQVVDLGSRSNCVLEPVIATTYRNGSWALMAQKGWHSKLLLLLPKSLSSSSSTYSFHTNITTSVVNAFTDYLAVTVLAKQIHNNAKVSIKVLKKEKNYQHTGK